MPVSTTQSTGQRASAGVVLVGVRTHPPEACQELRSELRSVLRSGFGIGDGEAYPSSIMSNLTRTLQGEGLSTSIVTSMLRWSRSVAQAAR